MSFSPLHKISSPNLTLSNNLALYRYLGCVFAIGALLHHGPEYPIAIVPVRIAEMRDRTLDDIVLADLREMHRNVRDQVFLLGFAHETVEVTGLNEVIILGVMPRRVIPGRSTHLYRCPQLLAGLTGPPKLFGS